MLNLYFSVEYIFHVCSWGFLMPASIVMKMKEINWKSRPLQSLESLIPIMQKEQVIEDYAIIFATLTLLTSKEPIKCYLPKWADISWSVKVFIWWIFQGTVKRRWYTVGDCTFENWSDVSGATWSRRLVQFLWIDAMLMLTHQSDGYALHFCCSFYSFLLPFYVPLYPQFCRHISVFVSHAYASKPACYCVNCLQITKWE